MSKTYDLLIVGSGIVGLAHAYEAAKRGLRVAVIEKNQACVGASIRNFGFITVSGQGIRDTWRRARYSSLIWASLATQAQIEVIHRGTWILCQRPEAQDVALAFLRTEMGEGCFYIPSSDFTQAMEKFPGIRALRLENALGLLYSPHEFRVESKHAIPQLTSWLSQKMGVEFHWGEEVLSIDEGEIRTSASHFSAERVVICPGAELHGVAKPYLKQHDIQLCTLQMLRVKVDDGYKLPGSVMTDNSLARYLGWSELPEAGPLKQRIANEMPEYVAEGIHLIAVQSQDGTLVVGDSHRYGNKEDVFASQHVDDLILNLLNQTLALKECRIVERWTGVYPTMQDRDALIEKVNDSLRVAVVTSGTGASTAFGLANDNLNEWMK